MFGEAFDHNCIFSLVAVLEFQVLLKSCKVSCSWAVKATRESPAHEVSLAPWGPDDLLLQIAGGKLNLIYWSLVFLLSPQTGYRQLEFQRTIPLTSSLALWMWSVASHGPCPFCEWPGEISLAKLAMSLYMSTDHESSGAGDSASGIRISALEGPGSGSYDSGVCCYARSYLYSLSLSLSLWPSQTCRRTRWMGKQCVLLLHPPFGTDALQCLMAGACKVWKMYNASKLHTYMTVHCTERWEREKSRQTLTQSWAPFQTVEPQYFVLAPLLLSSGLEMAGINFSSVHCFLPPPHHLFWPQSMYPKYPF